MFACNDTTVVGKEDCLGTFTPSADNFNSNLFAPFSVTSTLTLGVPQARVWMVEQTNFDSIGNSFATLFKVQLHNPIDLLQLWNLSLSFYFHVHQLVVCSLPPFCPYGTLSQFKLVSDANTNTEK